MKYAKEFIMVRSVRVKLAFSSSSDHVPSLMRLLYGHWHDHELERIRTQFSILSTEFVHSCAEIETVIL